MSVIEHPLYQIRVKRDLARQVYQQVYLFHYIAIALSAQRHRSPLGSLTGLSFNSAFPFPTPTSYETDHIYGFIVDMCHRTT